MPIKIIPFIASLSASLFVCASAARTQTIEPDQGFGQSVVMQKINTANGELMGPFKTNVKLRRIEGSRSYASMDGSVVLFNTDVLLKRNGSFFKRINTPYLSNRQYSGNLVDMFLSVDARWLVVTSHIQTQQFMIQYYNLSDGSLSHSFTMDSLRFNFNADATRLVGQRANNGHVELISKTINNGNVMEYSQIADDILGRQIRFISHGGNRIFLVAQKNGNEWHYADFVECAWTIPNKIVIDNYDFAIADIANNGRRILALVWKPANVEDRVYEMAIFDETDGQWIRHSQRLLSDADKNAFKDSCFRISEDGKVIAGQIYNHTVGDVLPYYDVFVLVRNEDGQWIQQKITRDGSFAISNIMLTDDGTKLFWLPSEESSVPFAEGYQ